MLSISVICADWRYSRQACVLCACGIQSRTSWVYKYNIGGSEEDILVRAPASIIMEQLYGHELFPPEMPSPNVVRNVQASIQ